ncbi:unnamed protein product [Oncorhynchus mykiss]|uniref:C2H2-type domain-containing protein n=1 Tax=Oncorhynchus mykiss TaxID=8022 RepID=A0A060VYC0_ONCMY|nr:unnamed protein product [Oncorhynchus mykiss]
MVYGFTRNTNIVPLPNYTTLNSIWINIKSWQRNICAYAVVIVVKMAGGETEKEYDTRKAIEGLRERFQELTTTLKESSESLSEASLRFCQEFCQILVEHAGRWKTEEEPLPLLEAYTVAILSYAKATSCLSSECENVPLVLENLAMSCLELLLRLPEHVPGALWGEFQSSIKLAHGLLQENGNTQLHMLSAMAQAPGVWNNTTLCSILSNEIPEIDRVNEFLQMEGPTLLNMRIKHLIKQNRAEKAAVLAKVCSEYPEYEGKGNFKQTYFVCLCVTKTQEQLMQEITQVDCKDALEMICNLESDGDEKGALCLCSAFLKRQLLQGDVYCAWELTLFWSKLLIRSESSGDSFLDQCRKLVLLSRNVCHILFLIKVIQSEVGGVGLPVCIEMCIRALQMASSDNTDSRTTICKTISCLLPTDFEVKQACQLTEFLNQPTVNSYYAVESLYNESDEKREDENLPVPNSLRCELLLALKTQWPFDPEFWDWRTLKRNCLALMGEEASIVSSIDTLNDTDEGLEDDAAEKGSEFKDLEDFILNTTNELNEIADEKEKNREAKKLREKGFVSARFRNWRAYMQYCVLCDKEFLGHRIVRHAQKHFKDGVYTCPICADSFNTKEILEPHVASHVKQSCKERLAAMKATRKLPKPMQSTSSHWNHLKDRAVVNLEAETNVSPPKPVQTRYEAEFTEDCVCPVTYCQKVFKFFRSLVTHVKAHKNDEEATRFLEIQRQKVVCQYCRRQFVNARHLNDHLQMHCGAKPYYCIQLNCTASFHCNSELLMHKRQHTDFKAGCMFPNCGRIFNEAYLLYDHEAQHYLTFTCKIANCGKIFYSQSQLNLHQQNHDTNEVPITSENHSVPKMEPSTQCSARQEETCSASVILDQKTAHDYVKEGVVKSGSSTSTVPENPNGTVKIKHSVESMLNSVTNPRKELQKCYVPLIKTKLGLENAKLSPDVPLQDMIANCEDKNHCGTNPLKGYPKEDLDNQPTQAVQKVLPQAFPLPEIKSEPPFLLHPYESTPAITGRDEDAHSCPLEACDRKYSTPKSLSRHVKKNHPDIFEDWKLAKKYKKVAKITSRKVPSVNRTSKDQTPLHQVSQCRNTGLQQFEYPMACSSLPAVCPPWEAPPNQTGLMQSEMGEVWTSTLNNCYADVFHLNEYPNKSVTPWQSESYPTGYPLERGREHTPANMHGSAIHPIKSESSLMNQMSEYVVDVSLMRKNNSSMFSQESNGSNLSAGGFFASYVPDESSNLNSRSRPSTDIPSNVLSHDGQVAPRNTMNSSVDDMLLSPHASIQTDVSYDDTCHAESEAIPADDKNAVHETQTVKRCRLSKRTKWPAIIKDGKVICRRCFREFSSTKSLGGHLSKRSQCKPLDEMDLTDDLPTSFLDFLNDPNVPETNDSSNNLVNVEFPQEVVVLTGGQSKPCPNKTEVWIELIQSKNNVGSPQKERKSNDTCQDDKVIEIQNALQMLDLVEAAHEKSLQENCSSKYNDRQSNAISSNNEDQNRDNGPKPFKCEMDNCEYGFMTKEALFRHLARVHDYTIEMIEDLKKTPVKFSPYPCHICPKTFTRTTGLRIHYEKVHHLTQAEMNKLKVGSRKKKSSNSSIKTEVESSNGTGSSVVSTLIKQEPLDIDIGCPMQSTNQEGHAQSSEIITAGDVVQEDSFHQLTVERLQSPQDTLEDLDKSFYQLESSSKTGYTKNEPSTTAMQMNHTPVLKQKLGQEAISSQTVKPLPEKAEKVQKRLGLQLCDADNSFSPYRPYRCVHEGCAAAFTIQQNLILHCRAMHQSSLPLPSGDLDTDIPGQQAAEVQNNEIRCQVKDCSRIFPGITTLVQHYLLLHKFTRDKATVMMSSIKVGTFQCDRSECTLSFTSVEKYIDHIKNFHKEINISERGSVDQTFKCEYDGCDRVYTTKSNLLRHEMKKHNLIYIPRTQQQRTGVIPNNGKENIENKFKVKKKNTKKKDDKSPDHWTSFGKPSLKSMDEASAMCTKNFSLQYPCMIKGCDAVERAERNIFRHYTTHGLTERYIEDQRSQFIFCKKYPRSRFKDANKSEGMSTDASAEETDPNESEPEISKTTCQRQEALDGIIQAEAKLSTDASSESQSSTSEVKKRGRPLKSSRRALACPDRRLTLRNRPADKVYRLTDTLDQGFTASQEEETEDGVALDTLLKFLETSPSTHTPKRKMSGGSRTELPLKQQPCQNLVDFRNPLSLQSVNNVKIVMDKTFSNGAELLLKQLQDMRPMVLIKKVAS